MQRRLPKKEKKEKRPRNTIVGVENDRGVSISSAARVSQQRERGREREQGQRLNRSTKSTGNPGKQMPPSRASRPPAKTQNRGGKTRRTRKTKKRGGREGGREGLSSPFDDTFRSAKLSTFADDAWIYGRGTLNSSV